MSIICNGFPGVIECGAENEADSKSCWSCGAVLPFGVPSETPKPAVSPTAISPAAATSVGGGPFAYSRPSDFMNRVLTRLEDLERRLSLIEEADRALEDAVRETVIAKPQAIVKAFEDLKDCDLDIDGADHLQNRAGV